MDAPELDDWWPKSYSVPEQNYIWRIPEGAHLLRPAIIGITYDNFYIGTQLPDGLHICVDPCRGGCDEREKPCKHRTEGKPPFGYVLQISKSMTLKGESHEGLHHPQAKVYSVEYGSGRDACRACKRHPSSRVGY